MANSSDNGTNRDVSSCEAESRGQKPFSYGNSARIMLVDLSPAQAPVLNSSDMTDWSTSLSSQETDNTGEIPPRPSPDPYLLGHRRR
jgi:hypothetical protein